MAGADTAGDPMEQPHVGERAREVLVGGLGRRGFLRAAAASAGAAAVPAMGGTAAAVAQSREILQPGKGKIDGEHYLPSTPDQVRWGYVPAVGSDPVLRIRSGATVTVDSVSH